MNITYEITKERGAIILIPTSMVDSLNPAITLALVQPEGGAHGEGGLMARAAEVRILVTAWDRPADRGVDMDQSGSWIRG
jgi:hypothetical protein